LVVNLTPKQIAGWGLSLIAVPGIEVVVTVVLNKRVVGLRVDDLEVDGCRRETWLDVNRPVCSTISNHEALKVHSN